jgi:hypothetical protein
MSAWTLVLRNGNRLRYHKKVGYKIKAIIYPKFAALSNKVAQHPALAVHADLFANRFSRDADGPVNAWLGLHILVLALH